MPADDRTTLPGTWRRTFDSESGAETYLAERGFSVGRKQAAECRGILLGAVDIQKWRNLSARDVEVLHGVLKRTGWDRAAPAVITIYALAPAEAHAAIRRDAIPAPAGMKAAAPPFVPSSSETDR